MTREKKPAPFNFDNLLKHRNILITGPNNFAAKIMAANQKSTSNGGKQQQKNIDRIDFESDQVSSY